MVLSLHKALYNDPWVKKPGLITLKFEEHGGQHYILLPRDKKMVGLILQQLISEKPITL
jgi:hypothetical protein